MSAPGASWRNGLHRFSIRYPVPVLILALLVTAMATPGLLRLRLRTDGQALVPEKAPAVQYDREIRREFGVRDPIVVLVRSRSPNGIFNPRTLHLVADLTTRLGRLTDLDSTSVRSLATESSDHFRPGSLQYRRLLEPVPETGAQLDELRGDLEAIGLYTGTLVSFDGQATAILIQTPPEADRSALVESVQEAIARADTAGHDVRVIGAPIAEALLGKHILEDLGLGRGRGITSRSEEGLGLASRVRLAIARHVGLLPLSVAVMALVFLICFRSVTATLLPLAEAGACLLFVFGVMGWTGTPVYLTLAVLPVILVSMGLADEIHVFYSYARHRRARPDAPIQDVVRAALDDMSLPVIATAGTTAVGFLSFAISPLEPVRAFGIFTAVGIVFCMVWTLTVIPALLVLLAPRGVKALGLERVAETPEATSAPFAPGWARSAAAFGRRPVITLAVVTIGLILCVPGVRRLVVQDSWISGFAPDSDFYRSTQYFNQRFFGTHRLLLVLDTDRVDARGRIAAADMGLDSLRLFGDLVADPAMAVGCSIVVSRKTVPQSGWPRTYRPSLWGSYVESAALKNGRLVVTTPLSHGSPSFLLLPAPGETLDVVLRSHPLALPRVLRRIDDLERFVRSQARYTVGGVLGPPDQVVTAEFLTNERDPEFRSIPSNPERVQWLWNAIDLVQGPERLRETVDPSLRRGVVTVFLRNANFRDTARLMDAIRSFERMHLSPERIRLGFAGDVAVSQALIEAIVHSQVRSILGSLVGILAVTAVLFGSLGWGIVCMIPAGVAVGVTFAVMGWAGIPLGVATSMFAAMVLGVGVDFAIHLVERFRLSLSAGAGRNEAILEALTTTGPAIVANALAVALGFGLLLLSRVPANARLGAITVVSLLACLAATFIVVPALLGLGRERPARSPSNPSA